MPALESALINGWKTGAFPFGRPFFRGEVLVLGRVNSVNSIILVGYHRSYLPLPFYHFTFVPCKAILPNMPKMFQYIWQCLWFGIPLTQLRCPKIAGLLGQERYPGFVRLGGWTFCWVGWGIWGVSFISRLEKLMNHKSMREIWDFRLSIRKASFRLFG